MRLAERCCLPPPFDGAGFKNRAPSGGRVSVRLWRWPWALIGTASTPPRVP